MAKYSGYYWTGFLIATAHVIGQEWRDLARWDVLGAWLLVAVPFGLATAAAGWWVERRRAGKALAQPQPRPDEGRELKESEWP